MVKWLTTTGACTSTAAAGHSATRLHALAREQQRSSSAHQRPLAPHKQPPANPKPPIAPHKHTQGASLSTAGLHDTAAARGRRRSGWLHGRRGAPAPPSEAALEATGDAALEGVSVVRSAAVAASKGQAASSARSASAARKSLKASRRVPWGRQRANTMSTAPWGSGPAAWRRVAGVG
jgi:hypothetical protein